MPKPSLARVVGSAALAVTLSACGGGGSDAFTAFFGVNGLGSCETLVIDLDLERAEAVLEEFNGGPACHLALALEDLGCDLDLNTIHDGRTLRARISGCTTPPSSAALECDFREGIPLLIQAATDATCTCESPGCATLPPVCVSTLPDPGSCENCTNGRDDDGDGHRDCQDPNCRFAEACDGATTTTTTAEPTTTTLVTTTTLATTTTTLPASTTTTAPSTTSTTLPPSGECLIRFRATQASASLGSLQLGVDYSAATGTFAGDGPAVECTSLVNGALFAPNHTAATSSLNLGFVSLTPFAVPTDVAECRFIGDTPVPGDFVVSVEDATDGDGTPATAAISVSVTGCDGPTTTTTLPSSLDYSVRFRATQASTSLGALQLSVNYSTATGNFAGDGPAVECTSLVNGALFAPNHTMATSILNLGFVALTPFAAPTDVADCRFVGDPGDPPVPGDFVVTIEDATDGDGVPATAAVSVTVTEAP